MLSLCSLRGMLSLQKTSMKLNWHGRMLLVCSCGELRGLVCMRTHSIARDRLCGTLRVVQLARVCALLSMVSFWCEMRLRFMRLICSAVICICT